MREVPCPPALSRTLAATDTATASPSSSVHGRTGAKEGKGTFPRRRRLLRDGDALSSIRIVRVSYSEERQDKTTQWRI
jgi:hypothetical protein